LGSVIGAAEAGSPNGGNGAPDAVGDDGHNRRVNLIERQRDPQRERSGLHRATLDTVDPQRSSLLAVERAQLARLGLP
jgi:hypothetical protein